MVGRVASPDLGGGQVAVLRLHEAPASHVTEAAYSLRAGVYVRYGTKLRLFIKEVPNFLELRQYEVRRIPLLRTRVNRPLIEAHLCARGYHSARQAESSLAKEGQCQRQLSAWSLAGSN